MAIFCLISSISAVELSNNDINKNIDDNIINTIETSEENNDIANTIEIESLNSESIQDETSLNQLKESNSNSIYVSTDGDDINGDGSKNKPFETIKQGIDNSINGSTIYLSEGEFEGFNLTIDKTLTIEGKTDKTIIDAKNIARIFIMNSDAKLTLIGLNLINGNIIANGAGVGGSIYNNGGELTLINCTIKDSYADLYGGAIFNNNGKLTIIKSNIINNSAVQYGGAIYSSGITEIEKSYFRENHITAEKGVGGAIACGGIAHIEDTVFFKNYAIYSAGAILSLANTTINNCSFINQTTEYTGGAISNHNYMIINNSQFINGYSRFYAAAILAPPSGQHVVTEVYNTVFDGNHVTNHAAVSNNFKDTELKMENCALVNNYILTMGVKGYGDVALDDNASLLYCWWGQNEIGNYYSPHSDAWEAWKINASKWLIMTFTSSNEIIAQDKNNVLTVSLHQFFDNETKEIYDYDEDINLPLSVKFYTSTGKVIDNVIMKNGTAVLNYKPELNVRYVYAQLNNQTLNISVKMKDESKLIVNNLTKYYLENKPLTIKLTDSNNLSLTEKTVIIKISGKEYQKKTDTKGMINLGIDLSPGTYNAVISFEEDDYRNQKKTVKITILKNKPSINAKNKSFKDKTKIKKYSVVLKNSLGETLKNKKVTLKVNGKTYNAKTDANGKAVFKINKLTKKGTFSATISYAGDKSYSKVNKKVKITVKQSFKTVSRGSKDKSTVKKIQKALKKNGYYLTYKKHYLKIDGIYQSHTERSVKEFQRDNGLKVTGKVDETTAKKLKII
ncbi:MAG: peptidoglycan-binding protein [Methanobrevibacter ruminantium]|uniref:peptidoglycan-binding protein n=1 Tax=Methanobrevibacter ruminantium TaxID=83816 RepID=UPI0026ED99B3|nr:peptidoglycan-binding protein [Methanobrevibacter ruminantium]MDD6049015.1 peptidoglycan-binding protein [Methanobrevibacter ruminantium]